MLGQGYIIIAQPLPLCSRYLGTLSIRMYINCKYIQHSVLVCLLVVVFRGLEAVGDMIRTYYYLLPTRLRLDQTA